MIINLVGGLEHFFKMNFPATIFYTMPISVNRENFETGMSDYYDHDTYFYSAIVLL